VSLTLEVYLLTLEMNELIPRVSRSFSKWKDFSDTYRESRASFVLTEYRANPGVSAPTRPDPTRPDPEVTRLNVTLDITERVIITSRLALMVPRPRFPSAVCYQSTAATQHIVA